jgi:hypothetical protein
VVSVLSKVELELLCGAYLGAAGGVLRSTAGNELRIVVLDQVFIQSHVLLFGQNGIVGLEAILGQQFLVAESAVVSTGGRLERSAPLTQRPGCPEAGSPDRGARSCLGMPCYRRGGEFEGMRRGGGGERWWSGLGEDEEEEMAGQTETGESGRGAREEIALQSSDADPA